MCGVVPAARAGQTRQQCSPACTAGTGPRAWCILPSSCRLSSLHPHFYPAKQQPCPPLAAASPSRRSSGSRPPCPSPSPPPCARCPSPAPRPPAWLLLLRRRPPTQRTLSWSLTGRCTPSGCRWQRCPSSVRAPLCTLCPRRRRCRARRARLERVSCCACFLHRGPLARSPHSCQARLLPPCMASSPAPYFLYRRRGAAHGAQPAVPSRSRPVPALPAAAREPARAALPAAPPAAKGAQ